MGRTSSMSIYIYIYSPNVISHITFFREKWEIQARPRLDKRSYPNSVYSRLSSRAETRPSTRELRASPTACVPRVILLGNNISGFNCTGSPTTSRLRSRQPRIRAMHRRCCQRRAARTLVRSTSACVCFELAMRDKSDLPGKNNKDKRGIILAQILAESR